MPSQTPIQLSTRNQLRGYIKNIEEHAADAVITLDAGNNNTLRAIIPIDAVKRMGLDLGLPAYGIISSFAVMLAGQEKTQANNYNHMHGIVREIQKGTVNANVMLEVNDNMLHATVPLNMLDEMHIQEGAPACAITSPFMVMLAVDPAEQTMDFGH